MVLFVSFGMVSYSHSIVTMVVCIVSEIKRDIGRKKCCKRYCLLILRLT